MQPGLTTRIIDPARAVHQKPNAKGANMRALRLVGVASLLLAGLNAAPKDLPITSNLAQTPNIDLEASIGGVVLKVNRTSPLPNVLGRADVFGRKIDRGFVELRYKGQSPDGLLMFQLTDVETTSSETTMSRAQQSTTAGAEAGKTEVLPPDTTPFTVDPTKKKEFKIGDVTVQILEADGLSLKYRLLWSDQKKK
jgi:hypothetical protein